jgi:hypothetical protein
MRSQKKGRVFFFKQKGEKTYRWSKTDIQTKVLTDFILDTWMWGRGKDITYMWSSKKS